MTDPRSVLAEALPDELVDEAGILSKEGRDRVRAEYAPLIERALSERGYTIVASDRLAGLEEALELTVDALASVRTSEALTRLERRALERGRAALSRSEATEKGAPRE